MLMPFTPYNFENKEDIYVYVEKYNKFSKYLLLDFVDSNELMFFNLITGFNYDWEHKPVMMEIINYKQKTVQKGVMYRISNETIQLFQQRIQIVEDSLLIGFRIELNENDSDIIGKNILFNLEERLWRNMDDSSYSDISQFKNKFKSYDKLVVRNIGQGNWNELIFKDQIELVFDCGTIYTTKREQILRMIGNRNFEYQKSKPIFILSHWDVDHYHFLLGFDDNTINSVSAFIYRGEIPNLTARKALGRFRILNRSALFPLSAVLPKLPKKSSTELEIIDLTGNGNILLQNAYKNRSRNKSGIGLTIRKSSVSIILSGDYDYSQISDYILPILNYECYHYLVVPHHGGKAGKFIYNTSSKNLLKQAIISVGANPYNPRHPHSENITSLRAKGFTVIRTDIFSNDYCIDI